MIQQNKSKLEKSVLREIELEILLLPYGNSSRRIALAMRTK